MIQTLTTLLTNAGDIQSQTHLLHLILPLDLMTLPNVKACLYRMNQAFRKVRFLVIYSQGLILIIIHPEDHDVPHIESPTSYVRRETARSTSYPSLVTVSTSSSSGGGGGELLSQIFNLPKPLLTCLTDSSQQLLNHPAPTLPPPAVSSTVNPSGKSRYHYAYVAIVTFCHRLEDDFAQLASRPLRAYKAIDMRHFFHGPTASRSLDCHLLLCVIKFTLISLPANYPLS